jgi:hypothetical protein
LTVLFSFILHLSHHLFDDVMKRNQRPPASPSKEYHMSNLYGDQQPPRPADFLNSFQNVSPEMLNFGLHAGQDLLQKQKDRFMPGVSTFWQSLKIYFAVRILFCVCYYF